MAVKIAAGAGAGAGLMAIVLSIANPQLDGLEGVRSRAYKDIGGVLTICRGHTGPDVVVGQVLNVEQCNKLDTKDLETAASAVLKYSPHLLWHPMQLAASISFTYNVGQDAYAKSSVRSNFDTGNFQAGCSAMLKYVLVNGQYSQGVNNRRHKEYDVCTSTLTPSGLANVQ